MATRRGFLILFGATLAAVGRRAWAVPFRRPKITPLPTYRCYFGTDTSKGIAKGIYRATFNATTGELTQMGLVAETEQPSFLALGAATARQVLYAVNESGNAVLTFRIEPKTGDLQRIGQVSSGTAGPCYVSIDATGHAAFTANYAGGGVSSYRIQPDGTLSEPVDQVNYKDAQYGVDGPNAARQNGPHPHCVTISPDNRFVVVCDLGHDRISIFEIDGQPAKLETDEPHLFSNNRPGSGPRHVAFHPNQRWVYAVNELDSTVDHYLWTATHAANSQALLTLAGPPVKTLAADFTGKSTAAEIAISPNGYFLYVSNRGEDSLVVFTIDQSSGSLKELQRISCGGKTPRHFTLDPTGNWILCGHQDGAGGVSVFRRDAGSGRLTGPASTLPVPGAIFTLFAENAAI